MGTIASQITSLRIVYSTVIRAQIKENITALRHWPLYREFTGTGEFPAQMVSNAENVSIWWRHHATLVAPWVNAKITMQGRYPQGNLWSTTLVKLQYVISPSSVRHGILTLLKLICLTHWGWDKMAAIFQTTYSNRFSWMKMYEFRLTFHWSLFLGVQLTIFQHWFR